MQIAGMKREAGRGIMRYWGKEGRRGLGGVRGVDGVVRRNGGRILPPC